MTWSLDAAIALTLHGEVGAVKHGELKGYTLRLVRCGRKYCPTCPHGPYWYRQWKEAGRVRWEYVGKRLPAEVPIEPDPSSKQDPRES